MRSNKNAQNTAEFAAIMAIVIAAAITMQTYVRRGYQSGVRYAVRKMVRENVDEQYEPYYLASNFTITRPPYTEIEQTLLNGEIIRDFAVGGSRKTERSGYQKIYVEPPAP